MEWTDDAVILKTRRHGETSLIVTLLSREYGQFSGLVRGGASKNKHGILQPGNQVLTHWRARLSEHLGTFNCELRNAHTGRFLAERLLLLAMTSACSVTTTTLPEREPHPAIYDGLIVLLKSLYGNNWPSVYVKWELGILGELGFGLDLSQCAATGSYKDLAYVSPKSGCAISRIAAEPYRNKMLKLPPFLINGGGGNLEDVLDGLELTGYFLSRYIYNEHGKVQPNARVRFVKTLSKAKE